MEYRNWILGFRPVLKGKGQRLWVEPKAVDAITWGFPGGTRTHLPM